MTPEGPFPEWQTPAISGAATSGGFVVGDTLSTTNGTWSNNPTSYSYQWQSVSGGVATNVGANQNSYVTQASDVGHLIQVLVTAVNRYGSSVPAVSAAVGPITGGGMAFPASVSADGHYLLDQNGLPFLLLADQQLPCIRNGSLAQIETVMANRQAKGYNGLWICLMPDSYIGAGANTQGPINNGTTDDTLRDNAGNVAFAGTAPNFAVPPSSGTGLTGAPAAYWSNVDAIVAAAASYGITCLFCPCEPNAGGIAQARNWGNSGCYAYGQFLGNRYKSSLNILWYHGNDFGTSQPWTSSPGASTSDDVLMLNIVAGIKSTGDTHLHAVELNYNQSVCCDDASTQTGSPGGTFTNGWRGQVDCNQTYTYFQPYDMSMKGYRGILSSDAFSQAQRYPPKPVFLGEANYEGRDNSNNGANPAQPYCLRAQDYESLLGGALMGQVWGNGPLHHLTNGPALADMNTPGAYQAGYWAAFFRSIAWYNLVPDGLPDPTVSANHTFVTSGYGSYVANNSPYVPGPWVTASNNINGGTLLQSGTYVTAAVTPDGSLGVAYIPLIQTITVDMAKMNHSGTVTARWFDPTTGNYTAIGTYPSSGSQTFTPSGSHPSDGTTQASDWVLVLTA